ncbi:hypothetical protein SLE2022_225040 [Rubroshorea leprosula]
MGSVGDPKTWVPYMNSRDCSKGFCSLYCPQWCYIIFPPPPPPLEFPDDDSSPTFSPLVIAIIGILASAFLLVSYYTIISKYCGTVDSSRRRRESHEQSEELEDNHNPSLHEPWQTGTTGLDEALIKSITVCKYKKGDGLIGETDCSVCLSEFREDESLRLLPKCSHAFHVHCIDTWLRSHSNCPLCRANIIFITASPLPLPPLVTETPSGNQSSGHNENTAADAERSGQRLERVPQNEANEAPTSPLRAFSDLGNFQRRDVIIEISDEGYQQVRRSVSMDHSPRVSVADILQTNQDEDGGVCGAGSSKQSSEAAAKSGNKKRMKRSFSSGRFYLTRGRVRDTIIPL